MPQEDIRKPSQPGNLLQSLYEVCDRELMTLQKALAEVVAHAYFNDQLAELIRDIDRLTQEGIPSDSNIRGLHTNHLNEAKEIALQALTDAAGQIKVEDTLRKQ